MHTDIWNVYQLKQICSREKFNVYKVKAPLVELFTCKASTEEDSMQLALKSIFFKTFSVVLFDWIDLNKLPFEKYDLGRTAALRQKSTVHNSISCMQNSTNQSKCIQRVKKTQTDEKIEHSVNMFEKFNKPAVLLCNENDRPYPIRYQQN